MSNVLDEIMSDQFMINQVAVFEKVLLYSLDELDDVCKMTSNYDVYYIQFTVDSEYVRTIQFYRDKPKYKCDHYAIEICKDIPRIDNSIGVCEMGSAGYSWALNTKDVIDALPFKRTLRKYKINKLFDV